MNARWIFTAVGAAGTIFFTAQSTPSNAARPLGSISSDSVHGATVIKGEPCGIPIDGAVVPSTRSHTVVTPSGNASLICHADTDARSAETVEAKHVVCIVGGNIGTNAHVVATRSGQVTFVCHIQPRGHHAAPSTRNRAEGPERRWRHGANVGTGPLTRRG
jgi:hypothetical protein